MNSIIVNNNQLVDEAKGISRYFYSLEPYLAKNFTLEMLFSEPEKNAFRKKLREQMVSLRGRTNSILWSPSHSGPILGSNHVVTVHDLISLHPESGISRSYKFFFKNNVGLLLRKSKHVVCISASVADMVQVIFGTRSSKISVIRNGYDFLNANSHENETISSAHPFEYLLFVGTVSAHKNVMRLIESFKIFKAFYKTDIKLVIAGHLPDTKSLGDTSVDFHSLESWGVIFYNHPGDEFIHSLYKGCRGVIMPSLVEGFGLPITEALSYNKPVICSDIAVFQELFGPMIRSYFNPYNVESIVNSIKVLIETSSELTSGEMSVYSEKIKWTWEKAADEYAKLFSHLS